MGNHVRRKLRLLKRSKQNRTQMSARKEGGDKALRVTRHATDAPKEFLTVLTFLSYTPNKKTHTHTRTRTYICIHMNKCHSEEPKRKGSENRPLSHQVLRFTTLFLSLILFASHTTHTHVHIHSHAPALVFSCWPVAVLEAQEEKQGRLGYEVEKTRQQNKKVPAYVVTANDSIHCVKQNKNCFTVR